jgi:hypothetical protein
VDLLDFSLNVNGVVYVAHDSRLPVPDWLQHQFSATEMSFLINGQPMKIFERHVRSGKSLTLGSNTEDRRLKSCNMYVVFVKRDGPVIQATALQINIAREGGKQVNFQGDVNAQKATPPVE